MRQGVCILSYGYGTVRGNPRVRTYSYAGKLRLTVDWLKPRKGPCDIKDMTGPQ